MLGSLLKGYEVLNLSADLGAGKTTFVKGLARGIGSKDRVASPTFTLSKIYHSDKLEIHHYDFYRLADAGVLMDQVEESINTNLVVTVIEWSEIVKDILPLDAILIEFVPAESNPNERKITITYTEKQAGLIKEFETKVTEPKP